MFYLLITIAIVALATIFYDIYKQLYTLNCQTQEIIRLLRTSTHLLSKIATKEENLPTIEY